MFNLNKEIFSAMSKIVTVKKHPSVKDNGMAEIYQSQTTKQALLHRENATEFTRITNFVLCRDFLVDSYSFAKAGKDFGIYGFHFSGSKMSPDWDGVYIEMQFSEGSRERFLHNIRIIHEIEAANKYKPTELREIKDNKNLVVIGDKRWLQNCLAFSLYSLLLRVACYELPKKGDWITAFGKQSASDSKYIASVPRKTLDKVFADLDTIKTDTFCGFDPKKDYVGTIHHNSGFISVFGWHTEIDPNTVKQNQHWQEMKKRGLETKVA